MEKEKKRQLYQLFGALEINQKDFEEWFNNWKRKFEKEEYEKEYEKCLPEHSENSIRLIDRKINKYLKEERNHSVKAVYNFIQKVYMRFEFDKEEAKEMAFTELIFRIVSPSELYNFMESKA